MNAAVLCLCAVIAGADARETITSPEALYALHDRLFEISGNRNITVIGDGAAVVSQQGGSSFEPKYQLMVVPCPGSPGCFVSGYVRSDRLPDAQGRVDWNSGGGFGRNRPSSGAVIFPIYVDLERNVLLDLERHKLILALTPEETAAVTANVRKIVETYVDRLVDDPANERLAGQVRWLRDEFVVPPPVKIACEITHYENSPAAVKLQVTLSAGERKTSFEAPLHVKELLISSLAVPAEQYFAAGKAEESK
ncbi:hypothetical protein [Blastopirellula marina]|uniref:Uncharacterized protein n=1 Tax=Blastopirellula marina TaxID=124 RepID=A0A2S8G6A7_9BACT|nr:hypothetical protein [Blastopirellula marina]PQO39957.1 hypothetical protein C5Y98_06465 [Blastopirellula marina]PTL45332.1 hypothetical protein C5Y97_06465 [Blastopirellula marina]